MNVALINEYGRDNFILNAIKSTISFNKTYVVTDYNISSSSNVQIIYLLNNEIGLRYGKGLSEALNDTEVKYICLLDDDDTFKSYKNSKKSDYNFNNFLTIDSVYIKELNINNIIKYHYDWHLSRFTISREFAEILLDNGIKYIKHSLDKFIFYHALYLNKIDLIPNLFMNKSYHLNSKMHNIKLKNEFYKYTYEMFEQFEFNDNSKLYRDYNIKLNKFLYDNSKENYLELAPYLKNASRIRLLYYNFLTDKGDKNNRN